MEVPLHVKGKKTKTIGNDDTALAHGSGNLNVFATPAMIALMENAAWESVSRILPEGFTTVGTEISVKHIKATPVGGNAEARSELLASDGKKLVFSLEAFDEEGKIGLGTHTRYIVEEKKFLSSV